MPAPKAICCHICGKKFFKHSLPIHLKKCEEMWHKTHSECKKCGQMVNKADWSDHNRHCKKQLSQQERKHVPKGPPKAMDDSRTGNLTQEEAAALIDAGSLPDLAPILDARKECKVCGRKFNPDRIDKHTRICFERAQKKKKRKTWDGHKKRVENTDFEQYSGKHRPKTPEIIEQWKKFGRRWRKETSDFRKIIHADDPDYVPPPIHPLTMARIKKATATLSARRKESALQKPTFSPKIVEKVLSPRHKEPKEEILVPFLDKIEAYVDMSEEMPPKEEPKPSVQEDRNSVPPKKLVLDDEPAMEKKAEEPVDVKKEEPKPRSQRKRKSVQAKSTSKNLELKGDPLSRRSSKARTQAKGKAKPSKRDPGKSSAYARKDRRHPKDLEMKATKAPQRRRKADPKPSKPSISKRRAAKESSRVRKPTVPRTRKPGVPRMSNRGRRQKKQEIKPADINAITDPLEKMKKLDELLSKRAPKPTEVKKPKRRRKPIANAGKSIVGEPSAPVSRPKVYQGSGRAGKRGGEFHADPNYQAPEKKLTMEEYRNREKRRRRQSSSSRSYSRPSSIRSQCEKTPPGRPSRKEMAELSTNIDNSEMNGHRKLSRKTYWEPQAIGGKRAPKNSSELRRRRADYFENLLKSN